MHRVKLRERKRLSHKPRHPLTQRIVEPLNMAGKKDQGFGGCVVGSTAGIFAPALVAVFAAEDLLAVFGVSVSDPVVAAAM